MEEFVYFKKHNGVKKLGIFRYISYSLIILYFIILGMNYQVFMAKGTW